MGKVKIINVIQTGDKMTISIARPEYEMVKEIADVYGISITQLVSQLVRHALKDGYEVEEIRV